ncbi:cytochrome-c peroxidase [Candidatus Magnetaquicoccus inordinatus]|uniref:cytochrome-c peroxidase n=1 Tax=Candidatus Magnetaquicoccus inordinatus TaxID=2496818 RepID=UPI001D0EE11E|nr:cytochrome c peroxidase [Candidatus Magnetaquicoccus inordinatus]
MGNALLAEGWDREPVQPLPTCTQLSLAKVQLGRILFQDPRLSFNDSRSCASCHPLERWGSDNLPLSQRADGSLTELNTPTVYNVRYQIAQFWNGRVRTLEEQAEEAIRIEMNKSWPELEQKLAADSFYREAFARIYHGKVQAVHIQNALAEFVRSLVLANSRFDRYLRGEKEAISQLEREGYQLFKEIGCASCHQGVNLGGNLYQKSGIFLDRRREGGWQWAEHSHETQDRFRVTGNDEDRQVFKVPSLRLVTRSAPYFHDGSVPTLEEAVHRMARMQLGRTLSRTDVAKLLAFLATLEGSLAGACP